MFLHEEYARRLCGQPLLGCSRLGCLIVEDYQDYKWVYVVIEMISVRNGPHEFSFRCCSLSHNGYKNQPFLNLIFSKQLNYEEYEEFIIEWTRNLKRSKIVSKKKLQDKTWEMVLYCLDGYLSQKSELANDIFKSVDRRISKQERGKSISIISDCLWECFSDILVWRENILNNYCDWIVNYLSHKERASI